MQKQEVEIIEPERYFKEYTRQWFNGEFSSNPTGGQDDNTQGDK